ncbi:MAG: flagellar protein FlgN [Dyella sp.]
MSAPLQAELGDTLRTVIDEMTASTQQLIQVLDEERLALSTADAEALNQAGEAKQMLMRRLEQLDAERQQLSTASPQAAQEVQDSWTQLLATLTICRDNNLRNGTLVGQRLSMVRRALAVLTGQDNDSGTYGRSGTLMTRHRSVPLAEA